MQAAKILTGLLGVMVVAACGAPAAVAPTPLNPAAVQTSSMQSYGPGAAVADPLGMQSYTDAAPAVATGDESPAPDDTTVAEAPPAETPPPAVEPTPEPTPDAVVPIMDTGSSDPAPKPSLWQKIKSGASSIVNKAVCLFKKDC